MKKTILFFTAIFMLMSSCVFADNVNITEKVKNDVEVKTNELKTKLNSGDKTKLNFEDKIELNSEDKTEVNSEDKTEINSEDKAEVNSEDKTEINSEDKAEVNSEDKAEVNSEDKTEINSEDKTEINSEDKTEINSEDKTEVNSEDKTEANEDSPEKILMKNLEKKIGKYGSNRKDLYNYYKIAMHCGEYEKADLALSRLCNLEKKNSSLLSDRIALLRIMKKYEEAEALGKRLELIDSDYVPGLINYALVCSDIGKYDEAVRLLNMADSIQPNDVKIKLNKSRVESEHGNKKNAKKILNEILTKNPKYAKAINNEGVLKYNSGEKEGGEISFNEAEEVSQNSDFSAEINKAIAMLNRGLYEKAYRKLYSAEEKNPNSFLLKKAMALSLMYLGRYSEAYDKALEAMDLPNGKTVDILNILGASKYMNEDYDEAENWFVQALMIEPDNAEANSNLALCFKKKALFTKAELFLNEAIKKEPHNANFYYNLATVYEGHGRNTEAIKSYKKYLELSPDTKDRKGVKARIENLEMRDKPNPKI